MSSRKTNPIRSARRDFLRQACCAAVGSTGVLSTLAQLRLIGAVAAAGASRVRAAAVPADYKALVCVFLYGGNDGSNTIIPTSATDYSDYARVRGALAVSQSSLLPIAPRRHSDGRSYGLHPAVPELQRQFQQGRLAILANVGTLVQPVTLAQFRNNQALPPQLFAHNEQATQWQSSVPDRPFQTGWGGRVADLVNTFNANNQISMSISLTGQNSFQVGQSVSQFSVGSGGITPMGVGATIAGGVRRIVASAPPNLLEAAFGGVTRTAIDDNALLGSLLQTAPTLRTAFPNSNLGRQLRMVATLISLAPALRLKRQIFFCSIQGFDTHALQLPSHGPLLAEVSAALAAFYDATVELAVANLVTAFTASDFGRTYTINTDGTDHGWGNQQFVIGGAVQGGDIYGTMPSLALGGPDDTGQGRWLPTTSVDEYSATLATWFGVSATDLPVVLPNIGRFAKPNLGFMG